MTTHVTLTYSIDDVSSRVLASLEHGTRTSDEFLRDQCERIADVLASTPSGPEARRLAEQVAAFPVDETCQYSFNFLPMDSPLNIGGTDWYEFAVELADRCEELAREEGYWVQSSSDAGMWWIASEPLEPSDDDAILSEGRNGSWQWEGWRGLDATSYATCEAAMVDFPALCQVAQYWPDTWVDLGRGPEPLTFTVNGM